MESTQTGTWTPANQMPVGTLFRVVGQSDVYTITSIVFTGDALVRKPDGAIRELDLRILDAAITEGTVEVLGVDNLEAAAWAAEQDRAFAAVDRLRAEMVATMAARIDGENRSDRG